MFFTQTLVRRSRAGGHTMMQQQTSVKQFPASVIPSKVKSQADKSPDQSARAISVQAFLHGWSLHCLPNCPWVFLFLAFLSKSRWIKVIFLLSLLCDKTICPLSHSPPLSFSVSSESVLVCTLSSYRVTIRVRPSSRESESTGQCEHRTRALNTFDFPHGGWKDLRTSQVVFLSGKAR